jgi:hypothetical protein
MPTEPDHVPNQILAMLKQDVSEGEAQKVINDSGGTVVKVTSNERLIAMLIEAENLTTVMERLELSKKFEALQLNYLTKY